MKSAKAITAFIAVLVMAAVSATSAAAFSPPEIGRCVKLAAKTGKFTSATCTKEAKVTKPGQYEWDPGAVKTGFTTTGGVGALETVNGTTVGCSTEESGGVFTSPKTVGSVTVRFTGCHSAGFTCSTSGSAEGEIVTNPLEGRIGFESKVKKKIGLDLVPIASDDGLYATFNCGVTLHISVGGSVLVPVSPADKMLTALTLKYSATRGKQKPEHLEGEANDVLLTSINGKTAEQSGITITTTQTAEESLEVNALF